ncbi:MAG TPA: NAD+ synthase [Bryobacteraceae bacterium]|jgi:NAD+ synthase (glutamine-hydrolysing)|nr:NAD+ synthase [Bryobacteraceae bacterium]
MKIALAQTNSTVGDLCGNAKRILEFSERAAKAGASVVVFPELCLTGYPPRDLLEKESFLDRTEQHLERLAADAGPLNVSIICGTVTRTGASTGLPIYNSAAVLRGGRIAFRQHKMLLPTYDVFDEARYFEPATGQSPLALGDAVSALTICEDIWNDKQYWERRRYSRDPVEELVSAGGRILISINASPYHMGKRAQRAEIFTATARHFRVPIIYVNQVGGNDQLLFDGTSFAMTPDGEIIACAASFAEDLVLVDTETLTGDRHDNLSDECEAVYAALAMGTRDYIRKCGFERVLVGLSGGIDSALTAAVAVDAVGKENVTGVGMPGPYSSEHSVTDARDLAQNLGIRFELIPIKNQYDAFFNVLEPLFDGGSIGVTEENLQSRLRGVTLMALSNKWGALVLTTGNKSELAVGYCTLYGDMCGGLAVISDVPKTLVYSLARVANKRHANAIPENTFVKPPSAELRPDQKDTDSLPPYETLDQILRLYIENNEAPQQIADALHLPVMLVRDIVNKVDRNEYKRQQAAPGLKVTTKAFGIGRRFPIAQRFSE